MVLPHKIYTVHCIAFTLPLFTSFYVMFLRYSVCWVRFAHKLKFIHILRRMHEQEGKNVRIEFSYSLFLPLVLAVIDFEASIDRSERDMKRSIYYALHMLVFYRIPRINIRFHCTRRCYNIYFILFHFLFSLHSADVSVMIKKKSLMFNAQPYVNWRKSWNNLIFVSIVFHRGTVIMTTANQLSNMSISSLLHFVCYLHIVLCSAFLVNYRSWLS